MDSSVFPKVVGFRDVTSTRRKKSADVRRKPSRVRSEAHLAVRSNGVPPFAAWVESVKTYEPQYAMRDARSEERRVKEIIQAKEDKLKEFQQEVRKRVKVLERQKQQEQLGKSYEAVEMEQNVIHQSSFSRKFTLPTRDTCVYRDSSDLTIRGTSGSVVHDPTAVDRASKLLDAHAHKIKQCSIHAREMLSSKSVPVDMDQLSELPGGLWNSSPTRDPTQTRAMYHPQPGALEKKSEYGGTETKSISRNIPVSSSRDAWVGQDEIKDMSFTDLEHQHEENCNKPLNGQKVSFSLTDELGYVPQRRKKVHFDDQNLTQGKENRETSVKRSPKCHISKLSTAMSDLIKPGQVQEERKKRTKCQIAVYRKLFMDLEREQVRENIKMKEHRRKMEQLKVEKEIERLTIEHSERKALVCSRGEASADAGEMLHTEAAWEQQEEGQGTLQDERSAKVQKDKEMERYIEALRAVLKERLQRRRVKLPPLCSCGPTVWDANPETCANNCMFYRNPKFYAKALSSLLTSSELI